MNDALERPDDALPPSLPEFIAERLMAEIESGQFRPGERLSEEAIAQRFGVSRAPVREALRILQREDVVRIAPRRGASVVAFSPEEIGEIFELRAALYSQAMRLFCRRATDAGLAEYDRFGDQVRRLAADPAATPQEFARATQASSAYAVQHCGNRRLQELMRKMTRQVYRHYAELAHLTPERRRETAERGGEMRAAMGARDADRAADIARQIVEANHRAVMRELGRAGD